MTRLLPLPPSVHMLRCFRAVRLAIERYERPMPGEDPRFQGLPGPELANVTMRELEYRRQLFRELKRIARRLNRVRPRPTLIDLSALCEIEAPPRGRRSLQPARRANADVLRFAVELARLIRPVFREALTASHAAAAKAREGNREGLDADSNERPDDVGRREAEKVYAELTAPLVRACYSLSDEEESPEDPHPLLWMPTSEGRDRLRNAFTTIGPACLAWMLPPHKIPPALRPGIEAVLRSIRRRTAVAGPQVAAAAFGAAFTGCGLSNVVNASKRRRRRKP